MSRFLMWPVWWMGLLTTLGGGWFFARLAVHGDPDSHPAVAGSYTASALILLGAAAGLEAFDGPRNARRLAVAASAVFAFLALRATFILNDGPFAGQPGAFLDGLTPLLLTPWAWFFLATGAWGWVRIATENRSVAS